MLFRSKVLWFPKRCLVIGETHRVCFSKHIFNIIGPWLLVLGAFVYVQYPTCTLRGLLTHESPGDMEPERPNDWRHRPWPRHVLLWGVRGNGKAAHNLRFHRKEFPSVPARLFPEIRFRGYPKESMRIRFSGRGNFQKGDESSRFVQIGRAHV